MNGWVLVDGTQVHVRTLNSSDRELEVAFLESLSEQTRYFRLMTPLKYLSRDLIDQLMDVNDTDRAALVAAVTKDGREQLIGVARYAGDGVAGEAELGITVADAWQRRGIATGLLEQLMSYAQERGINRLIGLVLPDNHRMLALARKLGFAVHFDVTLRLMRIERDLNDLPASPRSNT